MSGSNNEIANTGGPASSAEPSMEEILASIRRILKDDQSSTQPDPDDSEDEILVLDATMVVKPSPRSEPEPEPAEPMVQLSEPAQVSVADTQPPDLSSELPSPEIPDVDRPITMDTLIGDEEEPEELIGDGEDELEAAGVEAEIEPVAMEAQNMSEDARENVQPPPGLVGESASDAAAGSIGALIRTISSDRQVAIGRAGLTLEDLVREELRPLLKSWLDNNLPVLVERIVRAEIQRVIERTTS